MRHSEETSTLIAALKQADAIDVSKLFGSGIDVTLHSYTNPQATHMERVTIHAEDAGPVVAAIRAAIIKAIQHRRDSLRSQLSAINVAIAELP